MVAPVKLYDPLESGPRKTLLLEESLLVLKLFVRTYGVGLLE